MVGGNLGPRPSCTIGLGPRLGGRLVHNLCNFLYFNNNALKCKSDNACLVYNYLSIYTENKKALRDYLLLLLMLVVTQYYVTESSPCRCLHGEDSIWPCRFKSCKYIYGFF